MNDTDLINTLRDRFTENGLITVADADLLVWAATTVNAGLVMNPAPYRTIQIVRTDSGIYNKIAAIKGLRQMSQTVTGTMWSLQVAHDAIKLAEHSPNSVFCGIPESVAAAVCQQFNADRTGWIASW